MTRFPRARFRSVLTATRKRCRIVPALSAERTRAAKWSRSQRSPSSLLLSMPSVIALDAMGSDKAPKPEIEGALQAARHHGIHVLLVGPEPQLRAELARYPGARRLPVDVVHASEVITMDDKVEAIRAKRDSSIRVGLRLVREGRAAGFVTAGNTGAAMATAKVVLGALPGVDRPALAAAFPTVSSTAAVLLDVGANVDCTANNLEQFAVMGDIYCRSIFGMKHRPSPRTVRD